MSCAFVLLAYGQGLEERCCGKLPPSKSSLHPFGSYGYGHAQTFIDVVYSTDHAEELATGLIRQALKQALGFDLIHAWRNRKGINAADIVWTHTEKEHLAVAALKRLGVLRSQTPVIAQSIWLWDWLPYANLARRLFTLHLARSNAVHSVHSVANACIAERLLGTSVVVVPYGCDEEQDDTEPHMRKRPLVVAPGNDKDRDWWLLGQLARKRPDLDFWILSRRIHAQALAGLPNVRVTRAKSFAEMRAAYLAADIVVVPVKHNSHASGATTVLQSLGLRRPVAVTKTGGIELYGGRYAFYARVGDPNDLSTAIDAALAARGDSKHLSAARESVVARGLTERDYATRHVIITQDLLTHGELRTEISQLEPVTFSRPRTAASG